MSLEMVGFDRFIKLEWLDAIAGALQNHEDISEIREQMKEILSVYYPTYEARKKTLTVLSRIWVKIPEEHKPLRDEALSLITEIEEDDRLWLHWGLCLVAYPFFRDVASIVGRLISLQGNTSLSEVRRRLFEQWGQRSKVERSSRHVMRSMVSWEVIKHTDTRGVYEPPPKRDVGASQLQFWLLEALLRSGAAEVIPIDQLFHMPSAFPFSFSVSSSELVRDGRFRVQYEGLDLKMVGLR